MKTPRQWLDAVVPGCKGADMREADIVEIQKDAVENREPCRWVDAGEFYDTACKESFTLIAGTPRLNHYRFCPGCGRKIEVKGIEHE